MDFYILLLKIHDIYVSLSIRIKLKILLASKLIGLCLSYYGAKLFYEICDTLLVKNNPHLVFFKSKTARGEVHPTTKLGESPSPAPDTEIINESFQKKNFGILSKPKHLTVYIYI